MKQVRLRLTLTATLLATLAACGSGTLTVTEYATQTQELVATMSNGFIQIDTEWEASEPSLEGAQEYWDKRLGLRDEFLQGIRDLEPPEMLVPTHGDALAIFERITDADVALKARVDTFDTVTEHWQWLDTPEAEAVESVLQDVFAFCRSSQDQLDATQDRRALEGVPWIPPEMQEIVKVAYGCPPSE